MRYLHQGVRLPTVMRVYQPDLFDVDQHDVPINTPISLSTDPAPQRSNGDDYGVGIDGFNWGAMNLIDIDYHVPDPYENVCKTFKPQVHNDSGYHEAEAIEASNAAIGDIFAQNEELTITLAGTEHKAILQ
jgi:hypothetical protein